MPDSRRLLLFLYLCTALFLSTPLCIIAGEYLHGTVIDADGNVPLDSVRVASSLFVGSTFSREDGSFSLPLNKQIQCRVDTQLIESGREYSFSISYEHNFYRISTENPMVGLSASLHDLHGRTILLSTPESNTSVGFPGHEVSPGVYILRVTGFKPIKVLVAHHRFRGDFSRFEKTLYDTRIPRCPAGDTIYFCRNGYRTAILPVSAVQSAAVIVLKKKRWIAFDIHNHSLLSDGLEMQDSVVYYAFNLGHLNLFANSEHGGIFSYDTLGRYITDDPYQKTHAPRFSSGIPRWYSLREYSWPKILGQRTLYPDKTLLQGFEWNVPGHEHASVGFINDGDQPDAVADFEYQFDFNDGDTSLPRLDKENYRGAPENALAGLRWLRDNYPGSSYCFINHPSREALGPYTIQDFRDFHNLAPDICFAFEGMPGHHKKSTRGSYSYGSGDRNRTWGGADYVLAQPGGIWDALLGEGRRFWTIVNSDFHNRPEDHWPGEYTKTWSTVTDTGAQAWLDGLRTGEIFIVLGDLVSALEFTIDDGIHAAAMGTDFYPHSDTLSCSIRFKYPETNCNGDTPRLDHLDLISGSITGRIEPADRNAYTNPANRTTAVYQRFSAGNWTLINGWYTIRTTIVCTHPMYFRLRGTNNAMGISDNIDNNGNPTLDPIGTNTAPRAWGDLWFYSNPIFVYPR